MGGIFGGDFNIYFYVGIWRGGYGGDMGWGGMGEKNLSPETMLWKSGALPSRALAQARPRARGRRPHCPPPLRWPRDPGPGPPRLLISIIIRSRGDDVKRTFRARLPRFFTGSAAGSDRIRLNERVKRARFAWDPRRIRAGSDGIRL